MTPFPMPDDKPAYPFPSRSYEEAGHAVTALAHGEQVYYATIFKQCRDGVHSGGHVLFGCRTDARSLAAILAAGELARAINGNHTRDETWFSSESDRRKIGRLLRDDGVLDDDMPAAVAAAYQTAADTLRKHWPAVKRIADALMRCGTLNEADLLALFAEPEPFTFGYYKRVAPDAGGAPCRV